MFPTSVLQSKIRVCGAQRSNESPSGAFKRQNGLRQQMEGPRPDKFADVYTSALLATTMKPLNALPKFENHFVVKTVRFQVQLEADGYFFFRKFLSLQPQQAGRVGTNSQFLNLILQIRMHHAHRYVEQWQTMRSENLGLLLWGGVGTGKTFLAGCIANALMEQEMPVRMTNFARILNKLNSSFSGRNDVVDKLCRYPLLIIDDFGMERGTEYALEQIYNIVDSRYRSRKPLIVTTNLTLDEIRHPQDTPHTRIYDRLLEMCIPVSRIGVSFRKENAQEKLERMKLLIG